MKFVSEPKVTAKDSGDYKCTIKADGAEITKSLAVKVDSKFSSYFSHLVGFLEEGMFCPCPANVRFGHQC